MRWLTLVLVVGCVTPTETVCTDGSVCPSSLHCDVVHHTCVAADQLTSCAALADGDVCDLAAGGSGVCDAGVCLAQLCGDGLVTGAEDCDGPTDADCTLLGYYDAVPLVCSPRCTFDVQASQCTGSCGDGIVNGPPGSELCDGAPPAGGCLEYGFEAGRLGCNDHFCAPAFTNCRDIGFLARSALLQNVYGAVFLDANRTIYATYTGIVDVVGGASTFTPTGGPVYAAWGSGPTDVHMIAASGAIWDYDGAAWTVTHPLGVTGVLFALWGSSATDTYAVGDASRILRNTGSGWSIVDGGTGSGAWNAIWGWGPGDFLVAGGAGKMRRHDTTYSDVDASACWGTGSAPIFLGLWGPSPTDVFAVGNDGSICHYDGNAWTPHVTGVTTALWSVWGHSGTDVFAVGDAGVVLHYDGDQWKLVDAGAVGDLYMVTGSANELIVGGQFGDVRAYAGSAFASASAPIPPGFRSAAPSAGNEYIAGPSDLMRWADGLWTIVRSAATTWGAVWVAPTGTVLAYDDTTLHRFDGANWSTSTTVFVAGAIAGTVETDLYGASQNSGTVAHYNGSSWTTLTTVPNLYLIDIARGGARVFAVGKASPQVPTVVICDGATCSASTLPGSANPLGVYAAAADDAFIVGTGGSILHYDGVAWTAMPSGVSTDLNDVQGTSGTDVFAVGTANVVLHYDGVAWTPVRLARVGDWSSVAVRADLVLISGDTDVQSIIRAGAW